MTNKMNFSPLIKREAQTLVQPWLCCHTTLLHIEQTILLTSPKPIKTCCNVPPDRFALNTAATGEVGWKQQQRGRVMLGVQLDGEQA